MLSYAGTNWVRFGFVFAASEEMNIFVILCYKDICVHTGFTEIGFVLHNSWFLAGETESLKPKV